MTRRGRALPARLAKTKRHLGKRLAVLAAAIAVPAMAAPSGWGLAAAQPNGVTAMPFEKPGESFPGSAFYYLADHPYLPATAGHRPAEEGDYAVPEPTAGRIVSPLTRSLLTAGTATDHARALRCMTMAIYYEAATEPDAGQRAVAQVILNRVAHPSFPDTVCGVVFQGSERATGCQFTFTCDGSLARAPAAMWWGRAEKVAEEALSGAAYAPVGLATHYHTIQVHPYWSDSLQAVTTIGNHIFYRWRGPAGQPTAFADAYIGAEPLAAPHPRLANASANPRDGDPVALAKAYESGLHAAPSAPAQALTSAAMVTPAYAPEVQARGGDALFRANVAPAAGQVLEPYARSGQWLNQP